MHETITREALDRYSAAFAGDRYAGIAMNAVVKSGLAAATSYDLARRIENVYSVEVTENGAITNQKSSGRCWMFAALNAMRTDAMRNLNLEDIEFSQAYPLFWDKLERSNYFLEAIIDTVDEPLEGRLVAHLLSAPLGDGGQWDMFKSLIKKYGVVPKAAMPESFHSSATAPMNKFLTLKLREFACALRTAHEKGASVDELRAMKPEMVETIYRMLCVCLGTPPESVTFEARDKDKEFLRIGPMSPVEFFEKAVGWTLDDKVSLINAPDKAYGETYTIDYLGNVCEGDPIKYLNLPIDELKAALIAQLKDNKPVWFGCDVGQWLDRDLGVMDTRSADYESLFGTVFPMTKEQRLNYGESRMTHAMVFYGVNLDDEGKPVRYKVSNSWGEDRGQKGWYVMTDEWFDEFNYQVLIDVKYLTDEQRAMLKKEPIHLDPWDPMGALAK